MASPPAVLQCYAHERWQVALACQYARAGGVDETFARADLLGSRNLLTDAIT